MTPDLDRLYHLAVAEDWERARASGIYAMSTLGQSFDEVGFMHASFAHQVRATAHRFYAGRRDVVLVSIDPELLSSHPVIEALEGSDEGFPHLFEPLTVSAVVDVRPIDLGADGQWSLDEFEPPAIVSADIARLEVDDAADAAGVNSRASVAGFGHVFPPEQAPPTRAFLTDLWRGWLDEGPLDRVGHAARLRDGRLVGVGISGRDGADPSVGHLSKVYVEPWFWRLGIARALYDSCLDDLRGRGFERATLHVLAGNRRARSWYERLGWSLTGRPIDQVHGHVLEVEYAMDLG